MENKSTAHNEAVELVLLCQKHASKWVFYSCFVALNEGKIFKKRLIRQSQRGCRINTFEVGESHVCAIWAKPFFDKNQKKITVTEK
jgi:hypothetical protein